MKQKTAKKQAQRQKKLLNQETTEYEKKMKNAEELFDKKMDLFASGKSKSL